MVEVLKIMLVSPNELELGLSLAKFPINLWCLKILENIQKDSKRFEKLEKSVKKIISKCATNISRGRILWNLNLTVWKSYNLIKDMIRPIATPRACQIETLIRYQIKISICEWRFRNLIWRPIRILICFGGWIKSLGLDTNKSYQALSLHWDETHVLLHS